MDLQWQAWAQKQGAVLEDDGGLIVADAATQRAALASGNGFAPLTEWALIRLQGEDTQTFLQGQLSSDLREVTPERSQYSTYSTAKGRMQANFLVWQYREAYYLMLAKDLAEALHKRLSMFIMRAKVKAELVSADWTLLGLVGAAAEVVAAKAFAALPERPHQVVAGEEGVLLRLPSGALLWAKEGADKVVADELKAVAPLIGSETWRLLDIRAGIPWLGRATSEAFVAQMANMELIGAVNFKKGCYPGQEIVARTQYLGKLKRRLYRVAVAEAVASGDELISPSMGEQPIGMVVNVAQSDDKQWEALVVVQSNCWESGVFVMGRPEMALTQLNLPYSLESDSALH